MYPVVSCLTNQHDWHLVALATAICLLTSFAAIKLFQRACAKSGRDRVLWLVTTGAAAGYGIWATHFIGMLAYNPGFPTEYDLILTVASLLAAATVTGAGFTVTASGRRLMPVLTGGSIVGLGIAVMHYTGMMGLKVPKIITWDPALVAVSIGVGVLFSIAAIHGAAFLNGLLGTILPASLLAIGILAHHFIGMGAVEILFDPTIAITSPTLSETSLSVAIASAALAVISISLVSAFADSARQNLIEDTEAELRRQAERFRTAVMNMSQGICLFDRDQKVVVANKRYAEIYGMSEALIAPGTTLRDILAARVAKRVYSNIVPEDFVRDGVSSFRREVRHVVPLADGRHIAVLRKPLPDGGLVSTHEDITERQIAEARLAHLAHHDVLTDLPNRALLRERLEFALAAMREGGRPLAVLMLDLDRFKEVNDTLGHGVGDALLNAVADRLRSSVRASDTVARLGGDEFAIVQRVTEPISETETLATRILELIAKPFDLDGQSVSVGSSIGIALAPGDGADTNQLLKNADLALYRAKNEGRGIYRFFEHDMDRRMQARRSLERDLRNALANGEFMLHYQPMLNVERKEISGFEALLRWTHSERGQIAPADFIPLAEETGLIVSIGAWVLEQACMEAASWPMQLKVAVNVSVAQFKSRDLVPLVVRVLAASGLEPHRLEIEITESVMLQEGDGAFEILDRLHELGVRVALDDFGTGYSSLSNLRKFPFDCIKIDRSFVGDLSAANMDALAVVRSIAQLGASLGMSTTAEGIETQEQMDQIRAEGCTEMQGFLFSKPLPASEIARLFDESHQSVTAA
jgi:diguanylate cyclase (GGDEF)-like protein/PAS domain S-box-containing protein